MPVASREKEIALRRFVALLAAGITAAALGLGAANPSDAAAQESSASAEGRYEEQNQRLREQLKRERRRHRAGLVQARRNYEQALRRVRERFRRQALADGDVENALRLASATWGVPQARLRAVAACESSLRPDARNGRYFGLFQFGTPLWNATPYAAFSRNDPYAASLAAGWAFSQGMSSHWPVCGR